ncbi:MAG: phosphoribosylamine---glycine ligase [Gaiellaceae bacterium]|nr:phosphoribosylamine---glycine ligase [Gaiellaceae bacterium]
MKVLVVGSGGREHALAWKIAQSPLLTELHAAPGNPGLAALGQCHPVRAMDGEALVDLATTLGLDLVVIGPEDPLVAGVADELRHAGVPVFGPGRAAAQIEGSKAFAKDVMDAVGVPNARRLERAKVPCVIRADGLAAGKGVFVCRTQPELDAALAAVQAFPGEPLIEELLEGEELSVFALAAGEEALALPAAQDFKRIRDADSGPNTGGMGSYSPIPGVGAAEVEEILETIHRPVLGELARRGMPFYGLLYGGLIRTAEGIRVIEFNCRFGDPETQALMPLLEGDLLEALAASAHGELAGVELAASDQASVCVALATRDYPERGESGTPIRGVAAAEELGATVFQAGTALRDGQLVTNGGRVLNVVALGDSVGAAREAAYAAAAKIDFEGMQFRTDIAAHAAEREGVGG